MICEETTWVADEFEQEAFARSSCLQIEIESFRERECVERETNSRGRGP